MNDLCSGSLLRVLVSTFTLKIDSESLFEALNTLSTLTYKQPNLKMAACGICAKPISSKQLKLSCSECKKQFHGTCVNMSKADVEYLASIESLWRCQPCTTTRRQSMRLDAQASGSNFTLDDVMKAIKSIEDGQKQVIRDFNEANELLSNRIEDMNSVMKEQAKKISEFLDQVVAFKTENEILKKKVFQLEDELDEAQQYSRRNCVEVHGLAVEDDNVMGAVKDVGIALGMNIEESMIDTCHTIGKKPGVAGPPAIIIKFVRRMDAEKMLAKRREKRQLSTRHLNIPTDTPIYINESLTQKRRLLLSRARAAKREKNYKWAWVRSGKVYMRKDDHAPVKNVKCLADLESL